MLARLSCLCAPPRLDFEGQENGEDGFLDKAKSWSRSIEDLHHANTQPFCNTLVRSARQSVLRYVWLNQLPPPAFPPRLCYRLALLTLNAEKRVLTHKQVIINAGNVEMSSVADVS